MKIEEVRTDSYHYKITKFCCKKMKKRIPSTIHKGDDGCLWIYDKDHNEYDDISYCPFCGEKIETISLIEKELK